MNHRYPIYFIGIKIQQKRKSCGRVLAFQVNRVSTGNHISKADFTHFREAQNEV